LSKYFFLRKKSSIKSRHYLLSAQDYELNKLKKPFVFKPSYLFILIIILVIIFVFSFSQKLFYNIYEFYKLILQIIITFFILLFSMFFYYLQRYKFITLPDLFENNTIKIYLLIIVITIILLSYTLMHPNCDLIYNQVLIALYFLCLAIIFLLPWRLNEFIQKYPSELRGKIYYFLKKKDTVNAEKTLNRLCDLLFWSVNEKDLILSKTAIDELYDLLILYIVVDRDTQFKYYMGSSKDSECRINGSSNWFSKTILDCLRLNYISLKMGNINALDRVMIYRFHNLYSIAKEFNEDNTSSEIVSIFRTIFMKSADFDLNDNFIDSEFLNILNKNDSKYELLDLFNENYIIYMLTNNPEGLYNQMHFLISNYKHIQSTESPKINNLFVISSIILNILKIENTLGKIKYFSDPLIHYKVKRVIDYYKELYVLSILIMIYNDFDKETVKKCVKKINFSDNKIILKVKQNNLLNKDDSEDYFRDYNTEGTEKHFHKNKFNCTIDTYYKLKKEKL
jgi:hypothetical protein